MKYYLLKGEIKGHAIKEKLSSTRELAEKKLYKILTKHNLQVEVTRFPEKHTEEFVCDQYTIFSIKRVVVEL